MVRFTADDSVYIKILYWGMAGSGKTTILDSFYRLTKEEHKDVTPTGVLTKISMASGATLYFDRGVFQSTKQAKVSYHIYTTAGQSRFTPLRKKIYKGTDGVIFTVDSQTHFLEDNIESLKELITISRGELLKKIPLIVMLNKQDLKSIIGVDDFIDVLKEQKLWYEPDHELYNQNPLIYKTCALYETRKNIYRSFYDCARQILHSPYTIKPPEPPADI